MQWYQGGIADAVTLSRKRGAVFVVYIEGKDEKSQKLTEIIDSKDVSDVLQAESFVAVKLESGSVPHQQFTEIYKQTPSPSVYFIGKTGAPLEIVTEAKDVGDFVSKISGVIVKNGGAPLIVKTDNLIKSEGEASSSSAPPAQECPGGVCPLPAKELTSTVTQPPAETPLQKETEQTMNGPVTCDIPKAPVKSDAAEKIKLAQELIEQKRAVKVAEEEAQRRLQEAERRKSQRWKEEQEMKQLMEERAKTKKDEQEARDRIKRQIEEDKRENAARFAPRPQAPTPQAAAPPKPASANTARLQLRLPDGSAHTHDFPAACPLQEVVDYVKQNVQTGFQNFVLSTTFPRREFTQSDNSQSLLDLQLVPTAVILVLPVSNGAVSTNNDEGLMGMIWYLLSPILNLFGYIKGVLFGGGKKPEQPSPQPQENKRSASDSDQGSSTRRMPKRRAGEAAIRRQGNIHRLTDRESDDDNNTWNGNSTQQM